MKVNLFGVVFASWLGLGPVAAVDNRAELAQSSIIYIYFTVTNSSTGANKAFSGTGFIVTRSGFVLTASHLLREWKAQRDVDKAKNSIKGSLRNKPGMVPESALDLQIVHLGDPDGEDVALLKLPDLPHYSYAPICSKKTATLGDSFVSYGFPLDGPFQPIPGTFGTANGPGGRLMAASAFTFGMSGGPVYSGDGFVLGLVKGGIDGQDAVRWITPISFAMPLLFEAGYQETCDHAFRLRLKVKLEKRREIPITKYQDPSTTDGRYEYNFQADPGFIVVDAAFSLNSCNRCVAHKPTVAENRESVSFKYELSGISGLTQGTLVIREVPKEATTQDIPGLILIEDGTINVPLPVEIAGPDANIETAIILDSKLQEFKVSNFPGSVSMPAAKKTVTLARIDRTIQISIASE
jgi:hypothetical protein